MKIIRKQLAPLLTYAFPTRYDDETNTVEVSYDGGTTWEPFPEGDPRTINHTPPPDTANPRCDAAARISAATQENIEAVIDQIDASATVLTIANGAIRLLTPLFAVIPYLSLVYSAINAILALGSVALHAAFDTFDWDEFTCLVYKNLQADGRLSKTGYQQLLTDIANTYASTEETVLYNLYSFAGYAGLNDQAGIRAETGDCSGCPTTWTYSIIPADTQFWNWDYHSPYTCAGAPVGGGILAGSVINDSGTLFWYPWGSPTEYLGLNFRIPLGAGTVVTRISLLRYKIGGSGNWDAYLNNMIVQDQTRCHQGAFLPSSIYDWTGLSLTNQTLNIIARYSAGLPQQSKVGSLYLEGTGVNPFL